MKPLKRVTVQICGRVQGVFFRHTARVHAEKLGLTGFVRNEPDGSVTITAEGDEEALGKFLAWCRKGPPLAHVENTEVEWGETTGEFKGFEIL